MMTTSAIILIVIVCVCLFVQIALSLFFARLILHTPLRFRPTYEQIRTQKSKEISNDKAVYSNIDWKDFDTWEKEVYTIQTDVEIRFDYYPVENSKGVVICAHGFGQNKLQMAPQASLYRSLGWSTILYDQRHWGMSTAPFCSFGLLEAKDLARIAEWVREHCGSNVRIVATGVSMGAVTAINALKETDQIDCVIEDCGFASIRDAVPFFYHALIPVRNPFVLPVLLHAAHKIHVALENDNPVAAASASDVPILAIHGDMDRAVNVNDADRIVTASGSPLSKAEIFHGYDHGYCMSDEAHYRNTVNSFLNRIFGECT